MFAAPVVVGLPDRGSRFFSCKLCFAQCRVGRVWKGWRARGWAGWILRVGQGDQGTYILRVCRGDRGIQ